MFKLQYLLSHIVSFSQTLIFVYFQIKILFGETFRFCSPCVHSSACSMREHGRSNSSDLVLTSSGSTSLSARAVLCCWACLWGARAQQEQLHCWALHRMRCRRRLQSGWGGVWAAADWCLQVLHGGYLMAIRHQVCEAANRALDVWTVCDFTSTQPDDELLSKERLPAPSCKRSAIFQLHLLLMMAISRFSTVLLC